MSDNMPKIKKIDDWEVKHLIDLQNRLLRQQYVEEEVSRSRWLIAIYIALAISTYAGLTYMLFDGTRESFIYPMIAMPFFIIVPATVSGYAHDQKRVFEGSRVDCSDLQKRIMEFAIRFRQHYNEAVPAFQKFLKLYEDFPGELGEVCRDMTKERKKQFDLNKLLEEIFYFKERLFGYVFRAELCATAILEGYGEEAYCFNQAPSSTEVKASQVIVEDIELVIKKFHEKYAGKYDGRLVIVDFEKECALGALELSRLEEEQGLLELVHVRPIDEIDDDDIRLAREQPADEIDDQNSTKPRNIKQKN